MWIQQNTTQVEQWIQMMKSKDTLRQKLLEFIEEKHINNQFQVYINYDNLTLAGITQHLYDDCVKYLP